VRSLAEVAPVRELHFWSGGSGRERALRRSTALLRRAGCRIDPGNGWQPWDFRCQLGGWAQVRVTTAEQYDSVLRWRWSLGPTRRTWITVAVILVLASLGSVDPRAFIPLLPLVATLLHAVREEAALSKVLPRCLSQATRSMGMVPMEHRGRPRTRERWWSRRSRARAA
jgi:hypothetical protein